MEDYEFYRKNTWEWNIKEFKEFLILIAPSKFKKTSNFTDHTF